MATQLENLQATLTLLYAELPTASRFTSYSIDGQSVTRRSRSDILAEIKKIREAIAALQGPWEESTQMIG